MQLSPYSKEFWIGSPITNIQALKGHPVYVPQISSDLLLSTMIAADKYGKNVADFLATQCNATDIEGNYDFKNAKYNFNPQVLNQGGCSSGEPGSYPHGAVITPSKVILERE